MYNRFCINFIFCLTFLAFFTSCKEDKPTGNENTREFTSPKLLYPPDRATIQSLSPVLDWEDATGASAYRVQVSTDANFTANVFVDSVVSNSQVAIRDSALATGINYYWHVRAYSQSDTTLWSATYRFWVILNPPDPPVLVSPLNNSTGISFLPFFDWDLVQTAQFYRLQVSRNNNFTQVVIDTNRILATEYQTPLFIINTNTQYFWRVNASNSNGYSTGPWSAVFNFTTVTGSEPNSIGGRITFADTNFIFTEGGYFVSCFVNWPPGSNPLTSDTLNIQRSGNTFYADYRIRRLLDGNYVIAASYFTDYSIIRSFILGIYGCDTNHVQYSGCPLNPPTVTITNNAGLDNINFLSWADTTKRIFDY